MMPALDFSEVKIPEDMLDSFRNAESKISQQDSLRCRLRLWIYQKRCLSLIPTNVLQVYQKNHVLRTNFITCLLNINSFFFSYLSSIFIHLQLMRHYVTHIFHPFMTSMMNQLVPCHLVLILSSHHALKSTSRSSSGENQ